MTTLAPGNQIAFVVYVCSMLATTYSILGPREVPHAWAYVCEGAGKLLIAFAAAGKMEAFFRDNEMRRKEGEYLNDAAVYRAYGLELLGPPLSTG